MKVYATKYQIIIQADQREYILYFIKIGTIVLSQGATIAIIYFRGHMLLIRLAIMIGAIGNRRNNVCMYCTGCLHGCR